MLEAFSQAAKEKSSSLFPLAAGLSGHLSPNSHQGLGAAAANGIGRWTSVGSTLRWAWTPNSYDSASARLVYMHYFGARYYSGGLGRFASPDPIIGWPDDPQRWNMYAYAGNNPLKYVDPDGQDYYRICGNNGQDCGNYTEDQYAKLRKDKSFIVANGKIYGRNANGTRGDQLGTVSRVETALDDRGDAVVGGLAARADASNKLIGIVAGGSVAVGVAGGAIVSGAVGSAVQTTVAFGANIGARLLPIGMTTAYFGQQVMRWGTGHAQALARIGTITLQELQNAGITRQMAVSWQQFYSYVANESS